MAVRLAVIVLGIGLWLVLRPEQSYACSCVTPGPPSAALAGSAAVFRGKVVSIGENHRGDGISCSADPTTVEFDVKTVWKGPNYQTLYGTTARSESSCVFNFIEGTEYVVYSRDGATVSLCSRTRALSEAAYDLAELGQGLDARSGHRRSHTGCARAPGDGSGLHGTLSGYIRAPGAGYGLHGSHSGYIRVPGAVFRAPWHPQRLHPGAMEPGPGSMAPTPDTSGRQAGGCGRSTHSQDISFGGVLAVSRVGRWLRKRRSLKPGNRVTVTGKNP